MLIIYNVRYDNFFTYYFYFILVNIGRDIYLEVLTQVPPTTFPINSLKFLKNEFSYPKVLSKNYSTKREYSTFLY